MPGDTSMKLAIAAPPLHTLTVAGLGEIEVRVAA